MIEENISQEVRLKSIEDIKNHSSKDIRPK